MTHIRPGKRWREGYEKSDLRGCMVATRDASYIFQSILVKGNIVAYFSFFPGKNSLIKRVCPFKAVCMLHYINMEHSTSRGALTGHCFTCKIGGNCFDL